MIIATYKQWVDGGKWVGGEKYIDGFYQEYTSVYEDKSKLLEEMKHWEDEGNPMVISGIWALS